MVSSPSCDRKPKKAHVTRPQYMASTEKVCHERNRLRDERSFAPHVVRQQHTQLRRSLRGLAREGFRHIFVLESPEEAEAATVERVPLYNDKHHEHGPFDIIGDVHGCCDELEALLRRLGYEITAVAPGGPTLASGPVYSHPLGRKAVFVGDLVDRGPRVLDAVRLVHNMVAAGSAGIVMGVPGRCVFHRGEKVLM